MANLLSALDIEDLLNIGFPAYRSCDCTLCIDSSKRSLEFVFDEEYYQSLNITKVMKNITKVEHEGRLLMEFDERFPKCN